VTSAAGLPVTRGFRRGTSIAYVWIFFLGMVGELSHLTWALRCLPPPAAPGSLPAWASCA